MTPQISEAVSELKNIVGQASVIFYRGDENTMKGENIMIKRNE